MPNPHGLFHRFPTPRLAGPTGRLLRVAAALALANTGAAATPAYLRAALTNLNIEVPAGWSFTRTTVRNDLSTVEHFDPAKAPADQWTLQRNNGKAPTPSDLEKYVRFKAANPTSAEQGAFAKQDIDPGSFVLVRENADWAVFDCGFRSESAASNKMLAHLQLQLFVRKHPAYIERCTLTLAAPYSPVLGVKMDSLDVVLTFSPPAAGRPSLPATSHSEFVGRILFIGTNENLHVTYTELAPVD